MKTYFKYSVYSAALFSLSFLSACSDDIRDVTVPGGNDSEQGEGSENVEMKSIALNVSINNQTEADNNSIKNKWAVEDIIYVGTPSSSETEITIDNANSGFKKFAVSKIGEGNTTATFTGEVPADMSGKKLMVFYGNPSTLKVAGGKVKLDFTSQDQNSSDASILSSISDYSGEDSLDISLNNEGINSTLTLNVSDFATNNIKPEEVLLSFPKESPAGFVIGKEYDIEGKATSVIEKTINLKYNDEEINDNIVFSFRPAIGTNGTMTINLNAISAQGRYTYKSTTEINSTKPAEEFTAEINTNNKDTDFTLKGEGTESNPIIIDNIERFQKFCTEVSDKYYRLDCNISFKDVENPTITPITNFKGTFDGNGMTISNLTMTLSDGNGGLFAVNNGTIKNLTIDGAEVTQTGQVNKDEGVGILTGRNYNTIIQCVIKNSNLKATLSSNNDGDRGLGIIAGCNYGTSENTRAIISECTVEGSNIELTETSTCKTNLGGFVGFNYYGDISFSSVKNNVSVRYSLVNGAGGNIGGFIGFSKFCNIEGCSSNTNIESKSTKAITIAGFIGSAFSGGTSNIKGCYSTGHIELTNNGHTYSKFIGASNGAGTKNISNCYTAATISKNVTDNQAFISSNKFNKTEIKDCYFTSGTQNNAENIKAQLKNSSELRNMFSNFNTALGWENYQFVAGTTDEEPLIIVKK